MEQFFDGGEIKGFLANSFYEKPFPFYYLKSIEVAPEAANKGIGGHMLKEFTDFLRQRQATGMLFNSIEGAARDIYKKAGWVELKNYPGWFAYNLPEDIDDPELNLAVRTLEIL
jgi:ribosomal protein S18 acetylase RimI-like enzyme